MRRRLHALGFVLACGAFVLAGTWLGARQKSAAVSCIEDLQAAGTRHAPSPNGAGGLNAEENPKQLLKRMLAAKDTSTLWAWLRSNQEMPRGMQIAIAGELVDRLGWNAWDIAQQSSDDARRRGMTDDMLFWLAQKDPWRAFETWKQHRKEFDRFWGMGAIANGQRAAAHASADALLDVMHETALGESWREALNYAPDFDFAKVADYLAAGGRHPAILPYNILSTWAERSPADATKWLLANPAFAGLPGCHDAAQQLMASIVSLPLDNPGRDEALVNLKQAPASFIAETWSTLALQGDEKLSPAVLASATALDQRDEYLVSALRLTNQSDRLDDSWQEIPVAERQGLLERTEQAIEAAEPSDQLTSVSLRARQRWLQMVSHSWGLDAGN